MERLKKRQAKVLTAAVVMSVLFVVGIPAIILGATNEIWALMILGIIFTVAGFYGMPLVWVSYASGFLCSASSSLWKGTTYIPSRK
ncbi:MAG: hypothetical protein ACLTSK_02445 [Christensenellales bacterium]